MAGSDFFDEDLEHREAERQRVPTEDSAAANQNVLNRPVSDLNLTRMARHREDLEHQVAVSAQELDRLRMRQEELERERRELEELRQKQSDYLSARRDLTDRLNKSLVMMEKEQVRAEGLVELLATNRDRFKSMQAEIEDIGEETWPDDQVRDELTKALALLDECRLEYNTGIAKIDTAMPDGRTSGGAQSVMLQGPVAGRIGRLPFGYWFKAGLAASLPLLLVIIGLAILYYCLHRYNLL